MVPDVPLSEWLWAAIISITVASQRQPWGQYGHGRHRRTALGMKAADGPVWTQQKCVPRDTQGL